MDSKAVSPSDSTCIRFLEEHIFDIKRGRDGAINCERIKRLLYGLLTLQLLVILYYLPAILESGFWLLKIIALKGIICTIFEFLIVRKECCFMIAACAVVSFQKFIFAFLLFAYLAFIGQEEAARLLERIRDFFSKSSTVEVGNLLKNVVPAATPVPVFLAIIALCIFMLIKALLYVALFECLCGKKEKTEKELKQ